MDKIIVHRELYKKLAQLAYDTVLETMQEGEKTHPNNDWQDVSILDHLGHANEHLFNYQHNENISGATIDLEHALTRLTIIKYLETNKK